MYTSPENVKKVMMGKLTARVTDEDIIYHIEKADAYIDAVLGEVYVTPLELPIPKLIESISTDLAVFFLAEDLYSSQQPNLDQYHEKRYHRALEMLSKIVGGDLVIGLPEKQESGFASTNDADAIFTLEEPWW